MHQDIGSAGEQIPGPPSAIDGELRSSPLYQALLRAVQIGDKVNGQTALVPCRIHLMPPVR